MSDQIVEYRVSYEEACKDTLQDETKECIIENAFEIKDNVVNGPIYVYYQLDNFYQNHRRYVKSRENQ